ncbi:unnamed protein product [Trichobilharzia regenti]|nr:unnamed protein product [Trichobilharzia regenti]
MKGIVSFPLSVFGDFKVLLGHHIATVSLLAFSYITNHHRIGALILLLHDVADCWMEVSCIRLSLKLHYRSVLNMHITDFSIYEAEWRSYSSCSLKTISSNPGRIEDVHRWKVLH